MKLDDFIQGCWLVCDDWYFAFRYDQWWILMARCKHQRFEVIGTIFQTEEGLKNLYNQVHEWHEDFDAI